MVFRENIPLVHDISANQTKAELNDTMNEALMKVQAMTEEMEK